MPEERNPVHTITAQAEMKINQLVKQVHAFHEELIKKNKKIDYIGECVSVHGFRIEKDKDLKDALYAKLSEEHKLVMEERDKLKEDLNEKRKEVWDLEYKLTQVQEDQTSIHGSTCAPTDRTQSPNLSSSERTCQR